MIGGRPARVAEHPTLHGPGAPGALDPHRHADDLFAASHGPGADPDLWRYLPSGPFTNAGELRAWLAERESASMIGP